MSTLLLEAAVEVETVSRPWSLYEDTVDDYDPEVTPDPDRGRQPQED